MASFKQRGLALLQNRTLWRVALAASLIAIVVLATIDTHYPMPSTPSDKINHLIAFLELTILTRLAWPELRALWYVPALLLFGFLPERPACRWRRHRHWPAALAGAAQERKAGFERFARILVRYFLHCCASLQHQ